MHLHVRRAFDIGNSHVHLDGKMRRILHRQILEFRQQWGKLIRVGQKVIDFFRRAFDLKLAIELNRHFLGPFCAMRCQPNCFENILISRAATSIAGDCLPNLFIARFLIVR